MLNLETKKHIVAEVAEVAATALSVIAAEYRGLTVTEMTELRVKARANGVCLRVVRNTLARRAMADTSFACMGDALVGPLVLAFSREDPGAAARLLKAFSKDHEKLVIKALSIDGKVLPGRDIDALASLPTRQEALGILVRLMQAPITQFVRTVVAPHTKFVRTLVAYKDQKQAA